MGEASQVPSLELVAAEASAGWDPPRDLLRLPTFRNCYELEKSWRRRQFALLQFLLGLWRNKRENGYAASQVHEDKILLAIQGD
jgi:hypothetical protein